VGTSVRRIRSTSSSFRWASAGSWPERQSSLAVIQAPGRKHALLGGAVQAVVADLDDAGARLGGPADLLDVAATQRHAQLADLALGDLLVKRLP
jgi:hypothetical protein